MSTAEQCLRALAAPQFSPLTPAEHLLLDSVVSGNVARCGGPSEDMLLGSIVAGNGARCSGPSAGKNPLYTATWDKSQTIRAALIRWLCVERKAIRYMDPKGIHVTKAKIDGGLDLQAVIIPFPLCLTGCAIHGPVLLTCAETRLLSLTASACGPICGDKLVVRGNFQLRLGFYAQGQVRLVGASITGDLDCYGGTFANADEPVLDAGRAQIGGSVLLGGSFRAEGTVRLPGIHISRDLDCGGGTFHIHKSGNLALDAGRARIDGSVTLGSGLRAKGTVRLSSSHIRGDLDCRGGTFCTPADVALDVYQAQIGGSVTLGSGFQATGEVKLVGATIAGDLDCSGGVFANADKAALDAGRAHIGGSVILGGDGFQVKGTVGFPGTYIGRDLDLEKVQAKQTHMLLELGGATASRLLDTPDSWRALQGFELDGFVYTTLTGKWIEAKTRLSLLKDWQRGKQFRPQPYYQLAKVLRELGQENDVKQVLIDKEEARRKWGSLRGIAWGWNWFLGKTMAHGYQPQRLLIGAAILILLGGGLFKLGDRAHLMIPTAADVYTSYERDGRVPAFYPAFHPWLYSLDTFLPIINFGQKDHWRPRDTAPTASAPPRLHPAGAMSQKALTMVSAWFASSGFLRGYRYVHIACGWILITLGIAGVTGLVRKE